MVETGTGNNFDGGEWNETTSWNISIIFCNFNIDLGIRRESHNLSNFLKIGSICLMSLNGYRVLVC